MRVLRRMNRVTFLSFLIPFYVVDSSSYWSSIVDSGRKRGIIGGRRGGSSNEQQQDSSQYDGTEGKNDDDVVPIYPIDVVATEKRALKSLKDQANSGMTMVSSRMPSLFLQPNEQYLDRYSACLAATEGLRKLRDSTVEASRRRDGKFRVKSLICGPCANDPDYEEAYAEYLQNSSKVIRALGLSVAQFNEIGRKVASDPLLKEKVLEQAYLYRMTATLNMDKVPLTQNASNERLAHATKRHKVQMFAKSMSEIEELRLEQLDRLKNALRLEQLPKGLNISDPRILPLLNPKIRAIVEAFPYQAEEVVKKYGLKGDEFNQMLGETQRNPLFRWKVKSQLRKQESQIGSKSSLLDDGSELDKP